MQRPKQKVSRAEKNEEWFTANALWGNKIATLSTVDRRYIDDLYRIVTGKIDLMSYKYVTDPYNDNKSRRYPAKLINYDIISPMVMQILSEFSKRLYEPTVFAKNTEIDTIKEQFEVEEITKSIHQMFVNSMIQAGYYVPGQTDENGQPVEEPTHPDEIRQRKSTIRDTMAIDGQNLLDYVLSSQEAIRVWRQMFFDLIVCNRCYNRTGLLHDDIQFRRVKPQNLTFYSSQNINFVEDAEVVRYVELYTLNELVDLLTGVEGFDGEMIDRLENQANTGVANGFYESFAKNFYNQDIEKIGRNKLYSLSHVQWTAYDKIGKLKTTNLLGEEEIIYVDDTYVPNEFDDIDWQWCAATYEAYVIQNQYVIGGKRVEGNRADYDSPHVNKKHYNGTVYMYHTGLKFDSIVEKLYAYQELYNVIKYKIQYTINKNKDKIAVIPIGLLGHFKEEEDYVIDYDAVEGKQVARPVKNKNDSSIAKAMYYADTTQMLFIDESAPNAQQAVNMLKDVDLSLGNYIQYLMNYAMSIKAEASELIGFNRFRRAEINSSDRVSNVEAAQYSGSLIIEEYFTIMKEVQDRDCQKIIDLGRIAFRKGKRTHFLRGGDGEKVMFNLMPYSLDHAKFGVFAKDSGKEKQKLDDLKQFALTLSQNSELQAPIARILAADGNINKLVQDIELMEDEMLQRKQQEQAMQQQMNDANIQAKQQEQEAELQFKYYKVDADNKVKLEQHYTSLLNGGNNDIEILKLREQMFKNQADAAIKAEELNVKREDIAAKVEISKDKVNVAKVNK